MASRCTGKMTLESALLLLLALSATETLAQGPPNVTRYIGDSLVQVNISTDSSKSLNCPNREGSFIGVANREGNNYVSSTPTFAVDLSYTRGDLTDLQRMRRERLGAYHCLYLEGGNVNAYSLILTEKPRPEQIPNSDIKRVGTGHGEDLFEPYCRIPAADSSDLRMTPQYSGYYKCDKDDINHAVKISVNYGEKSMKEQATFTLYRTGLPPLTITGSTSVEGFTTSFDSQGNLAISFTKRSDMEDCRLVCKFFGSSDYTTIKTVLPKLMSVDLYVEGEKSPPRRVFLSGRDVTLDSSTSNLQFCTGAQFVCDQTCKDASLMCDKKADCSDGADEAPENCDKCEPNEVKCETHNGQSPTKRCVLKHWLCDGQDDCGNGYDENLSPSSRADNPIGSSEKSWRLDQYDLHSKGHGPTHHQLAPELGLPTRNGVEESNEVTEREPVGRYTVLGTLQFVSLTKNMSGIYNCEAVNNCKRELSYEIDLRVSD
uniref:Ig-like domain-containing protein n=1 Tax=Macrostomum lignano TaxID=282301 RepID=A0A1I8IZI3_9PLAT